MLIFRKYLFPILLVVLSVRSYSFNGPARNEIIRSEDFLEFKRQRFQRLRESQTDNTYIQCIKDEHERIPTPRPPFGAYYQIRHQEYSHMERTYIINKTEACIEKAYELERCDAHHDNSIICDGIVYSNTVEGERTTVASPAINNQSAIKDALNSIRIEDAIREALGQ